MFHHLHFPQGAIEKVKSDFMRKFSFKCREMQKVLDEIHLYFSHEKSQNLSQRHAIVKIQHKRAKQALRQCYV